MGNRIPRAQLTHDMGSLVASISLSLAPATLPPGLTPGGRALAEKMPGVTGPFGFFDPLGLTPESKEELDMFREAELAHCRVAMVGALGYLVQAHFSPIFPEVDGPVIRHLDQVLADETGQAYCAVLLFAIWFSEINRARTGWMEPDVEVRTLRKGYLPGDLNFDPLNMKPSEPSALLAMQNKELNNGRLAMLAIAGMTVQELVTGSQVF